MLRNTYLYKNRMFLNKVKCSIVWGGKGKDNLVWLSLNVLKALKGHTIKDLWWICLKQPKVKADIENHCSNQSLSLSFQFILAFSLSLHIFLFLICWRVRYNNDIHMIKTVECAPGLDWYSTWFFTCTHTHFRVRTLSHTHTHSYIHTLLHPHTHTHLHVHALIYTHNTHTHL